MAGEFVFDARTADFMMKVIEKSKSVPVLVDFWAEWCAPCKRLGPVLERVVEKLGGKVLLAKVNVDENQALAQQLAPYSVNVNTICPGIIYTPMWQEGAKLLANMDPRFKDLDITPEAALDFMVQMAIPFKRMQTPEDIGNAAVFLASDEAKEITGQALNICGGMHFA